MCSHCLLSTRKRGFALSDVLASRGHRCIFPSPPRYVSSFLSRIGFGIPTLFVLVDFHSSSPAIAPATQPLALSACRIIRVPWIRTYDLDLSSCAAYFWTTGDAGQSVLLISMVPIESLGATGTLSKKQLTLFPAVPNRFRTRVTILVAFFGRSVSD